MRKRYALKASDDSHIRRAMKICDMSEKELSLAMGLSVSAVPSWLKFGNIPMWSVLSAEGLQVRNYLGFQDSWKN